MNRILLSAAAALSLGLAACETATPYQPAPPGPTQASNGYGYRDYRADAAETHGKADSSVTGAAWRGSRVWAARSRDRGWRPPRGR